MVKFMIMSIFSHREIISNGAREKVVGDFSKYDFVAGRTKIEISHDSEETSKHTIIIFSQEWCNPQG